MVIVYCFGVVSNQNFRDSVMINGRLLLVSGRVDILRRIKQLSDNVDLRHNKEIFGKKPSSNPR